jgi:hypothetical protein
MRIWQPSCLITTSMQPPQVSKSMRSNPRPRQARPVVGQAAAPKVVQWIGDWMTMRLLIVGGSDAGIIRRTIQAPNNSAFE